MKKLTPIKAIRKHCKDCSGNSTKEVANCLISNCSLYPYRMGMRPRTYEKRLAKRQVLDRKC